MLDTPKVQNESVFWSSSEKSMENRICGNYVLIPVGTSLASLSEALLVVGGARYRNRSDEPPGLSPL